MDPHLIFQREREETLVELETAKDRLEMAQASHNRTQEEKEITNKELERLLEKYDRWVTEEGEKVLFFALRWTEAKTI